METGLLSAATQIEVSYSLTPAAYLEAQRAQMKSSWWYRVLLLHAVVFALLAVYEVVVVDIFVAGLLVALTAFIISYPLLVFP